MNFKLNTYVHIDKTSQMRIGFMTLTFYLGCPIIFHSFLLFSLFRWAIQANHGPLVQD